jgi:hypothetical protein
MTLVSSYRLASIWVSILLVAVTQLALVPQALGQNSSHAGSVAAVGRASVGGNATQFAQCVRCDGKGRTGQVCAMCDGRGTTSGHACGWCAGSGRPPKCGTCNGSGKVAILRHVGSAEIGTRREPGWSVRRAPARTSYTVFDPFKVVPVDGYRRDNGVFVRAHKRSLPDTGEFRRAVPTSRSYSRSLRPYPGQQTSRSYVTSPSGGGRVNVRGYWRKDGTYVRPHTRSK